jgi:hypothetical protein
MIYVNPRVSDKERRRMAQVDADRRGWRLVWQKGDNRTGDRIELYMLVDKRTREIIAGQGFSLTLEQIVGICAGTLRPI